MYSSLRFPNLVIYLVKDNKEVLSNKEIFKRKYSNLISVFKAWKDLEETYKVLKVETEIATDNIIVNSKETLLNTVSITL
jgi:hypothetical protein